MKKIFSEEHVLPRPVERLPEYAHSKARQTLSERIVDAFGLSTQAASAIANAVVDPAAVRKSIGEPTDPQVEEISVPGGTLLGIRTTIWSRRLIPDPRNPRIGPSRRHPFAVEPGTGGEDAKFRPVPEPRSREGASPETAELSVDVESPQHLTWASQQAATYVLAENDWRDSIASQGVMEAVWVVATTYNHGDGSAPATTMTTVEGSSRATAVHALLKIRSADVPYDDNESKLRLHIKKVNLSLPRPNGEEQIALRCERIPALILVGFRKHPAGNTGFPTAIKSFVALRHVDPPKAWGEGPENESLADEVLDELYRRDLISATHRDYFAGACTRAEARAAHLSDDPAVRATQIVKLFTSEDDGRINDAIRIAFTSQSTRKRITSKLRNELATALILRATAEDRAKTDQARRYLRHSFGKAVHREKWESTDRDLQLLVKEALKEVQRSIGDNLTEPGPASLELAVRAAYPLVVSGRLNADSNFNNAQPDRRNPGEVLDAMRRSEQGVFQIAQAARDFAAEEPIRAVDENGEVRKLADGSGDQTVNDVYLRAEFPPPGKARAPRTGDTPVDLYENRLNAFSNALDGLEQTFVTIGQVVGDDGRSLVDARGVEPRTCAAWREVLNKINEELIVWGSTFRRLYGTASEPSTQESDDGEDGAGPSEREDPYADSYDGWERSEEAGKDQPTT